MHRHPAAKALSFFHISLFYQGKRELSHHWRGYIVYVVCAVRAPAYPAAGMRKRIARRHAQRHLIVGYKAIKAVAVFIVWLIAPRPVFIHGSYGQCVAEHNAGAVYAEPAAGLRHHHVHAQEYACALPSLKLHRQRYVKYRPVLRKRMQRALPVYRNACYRHAVWLNVVCMQP